MRCEWKGQRTELVDTGRERWWSPRESRNDLHLPLDLRKSKRLPLLIHFVGFETPDPWADLVRSTSNCGPLGVSGVLRIDVRLDGARGRLNVHKTPTCVSGCQQSFDS